MKLTRTICWTLTAALATAGIGGALYAQERYDEKVRSLFFAGFRGDTASLDKGMKITEDTLAAEPKHAQARVWHGAGVFFRSGMAFQKGDVSNGAVLPRESQEFSLTYAVYNPMACFTLSQVSRAMGVTRSAPSRSTRAT